MQAVSDNRGFKKTGPVFIPHFLAPAAVRVSITIAVTRGNVERGAMSARRDFNRSQGKALLAT